MEVVGYEMKTLAITHRYESKVYQRAAYALA